MSDYIRRQDVMDLWNKYRPTIAVDAIDYDMRLKRLPSADVVQVVRCKDCKHYYFADNRIPQEQRYVCEINGEIWKPDSFCSYGEREE